MALDYCFSVPSSQGDGPWRGMAGEEGNYANKAVRPRNGPIDLVL